MKQQKMTEDSEKSEKFEKKMLKVTNCSRFFTDFIERCFEKYDILWYNFTEISNAFTE